MTNGDSGSRAAGMWREAELHPEGLFLPQRWDVSLSMQVINEKSEEENDHSSHSCRSPRGGSPDRAPPPGTMDQWRDFACLTHIHWTP